MAKHALPGYALPPDSHVAHALLYGEGGFF